MKLTQIISGIAVVMMVMVAGAVMAQAPTPPTPPTPPEVPLDGGLSALVAGGAALGARYYWKKRKNQKEA